MIILSVIGMVVSSFYVLLGGIDDSDAFSTEEHRESKHSPHVMLDMPPVKKSSDSDTEAVVARHKVRRKKCRQIHRNNTFKMDTDFWKATPTDHASYYLFISDNVRICYETNVIDLLVLVPSKPSGFQDRARIRKTWGNRAQYSTGVIQTVFLIGATDSDATQNNITTENEKYGDVVQMDFEDSYERLTLKIVLGLHWASTYCPNSKFIMKVDDDTQWAQLDNLLEYLRINRDTMLKTGVVCAARRVGTVVARETGYHLGKWKTTPEQYPDDCYPPYCDGCAGYVMSQAMAKKLYSISVQSKLFWLEDIYVTGILPHIASFSVTQMQRQFLHNTCELRA